MNKYMIQEEIDNLISNKIDNYTNISKIYSGYIAGTDYNIKVNGLLPAEIIKGRQQG